MGRVLKLQVRPDGTYYAVLPPSAPAAQSELAALRVTVAALQAQVAALASRPAEAPAITFSPTIQPAVMPEPAPVVDWSARVASLEVAVASLAVQVAMIVARPDPKAPIVNFAPVIEAVSGATHVTVDSHVTADVRLPPPRARFATITNPDGSTSTIAIDGAPPAPSQE